MAEIASRKLRNETRRVLERVEAGESVTITVSGRPVATLEPVRSRRRWTSREEFVRALVQADAGLTAVLAGLAPDRTDELPSA
jgi:prevent-host-death family protein